MDFQSEKLSNTLTQESYQSQLNNFICWVPIKGLYAENSLEQLNFSMLFFKLKQKGEQITFVLCFESKISNSY